MIPKLIVVLLTLFSLVLGSQPKFLMPEEAFKVSATLKKKCTISATITLGEHIHLYASKIKANIADDEAQGIIIERVILPRGIEDQGEMIYTASPTIDIVLAKTKVLDTNVPVTLILEYQGCSAQGLCYEPMKSTFVFNIETSALQLKNDAAGTSPDDSVLLSETDRIAQSFIEGNIWMVLLTVFTFGLLLALTPCVFPMIPILSSIIVAQGHHMSAKRGFLLSLVYVLAMSVAYTLAGVAAGLFGGNIQIALQNPWVISTFALLFVGLAMSMFGFFKIGLPASWQTRLSRSSQEASQKGGYLGVALMGFLSALIVGPCVAPPLAGALVYIGQSGDALLGGAALFVLSLGMGLPLLLIGIGAGRYMPRPGGWMDTVSHIFGVVMLAIAIWMLGRILEPSITLLLWSALLIIVAVYLGALEPLTHKGIKAFYKGVGVLLLAYGLMLLYGALRGGVDPLRPLEHASNASGVVPDAYTSGTLAFETIHSNEALDAILARSQGKKVLLDFYADWCASCKELDDITFKDPQVIAALKRYILVRADVTDNTESETALTKRFGLFGPPGIIFFDHSGKQIKSADIVGYKDPKNFLDHLQNLE